MNYFKIAFGILFFSLSCDLKKNETLFSLTNAQNTGLVFENNVPFTEEFNTYTYRNFYNGGGVAVGDINNDGLADIYFTGNIADNKLYLNKGSWKFEDISVKAGVDCHNVWSTGVTMVDINADGWLDIYVCKAGKPGGINRHNELFINNKNLTFTERAAEYGLDINGLSIHSSFFDYDLDGDLDCYILNNSLRSVGGFDLKEGQRNIPDPEGNRLMRNDNGHFADVSGSAGIYSSKIGYGLGITVSDFNEDYFPDIFLSNDFFEKDYLYINNQNGTFTESSDTCFTSLSMGSMGADASDLDNDMHSDLFVTEMLPQDYERKRTKNQYESWDKYVTSVANGYHHQFSRNMLQKNIGKGQFLELGRMAGVSDTDWSWSAMCQDFDNDGMKDIFVTNGLYKDLLDKDYLSFSANETMIKSKIDNKEKVITMLVDSMPSSPVKNCMFRNKGDLRFDNVSNEWGFGTPTFSNGCAYGDLDNDGDLDLVINNVNQPAFVYRNNTDTVMNRSIRFLLIGENGNTQALGARVFIKYNHGMQSMVENYTSKGFQSCVEAITHIGLGETIQIDSAIVVWPDKRVTYLANYRTNHQYKVYQKDAQEVNVLPTFKPLDEWEKENTLIPFVHQELDLNIFTRERLLAEMPGFDGPALASTDLNSDGIDDLFCGGGRNQGDVLYLSNGKGYQPITYPFDQDGKSESTKAKFFDSDGDGDLDLYVAHGGKTFSNFAVELNDRLYLNQGKGQFVNAQPLPFPNTFYTGDFVVEDINNDKKPDIIIAEKMKPSLFGLPCSVHVLYNLGNNAYQYESPEALQNIGMISSIVCFDMNGDGYKDLAIAGKWMPLTFAMSKKGSFKNSSVSKIDSSVGLWNVLNASDIDGDGDQDIVCGNEGTNTFYKPGMKMFIQDFDNNGSVEQIICDEHYGKYIPIHDIDEMYSQMPFLKKKFLKYSSFAKADMSKLFSKEALASASSLKLDELHSMILVNQGNYFHKLILPAQAQYSSVYAIFIDAQKGKTILYFGCNQYRVKPQFGRSDASDGLALEILNSDKIIHFNRVTHLGIKGQVRNFSQLNDNLVVGINGEKLTFLKRRHE